MTTSTFVIFPTHLYQDTDLLKQYDNIVIVEDRMFFYDKVRRPYRYNKIKLAYMRACMKYYETYLRSRGFNVSYIDFDDAPQSYSNITCYDPLDHEHVLGDNCTVVRELPNFILQTMPSKTFYNNAAFFNYMKKETNILVGVKSQDKLNQQPPPENMHILPPKRYKSAFVRDAINYIDSHPIFKDNHGITQNVALYPCTHVQARNALRNFIKLHLSSFGTYQDAIVKEHVYMHHSNISCALNNGLLTPTDVITEVMKQDVPMNNVEGFVRQVLGWREYMRYVYVKFGRSQMKLNHWGAVNRLNWNVWRTGTTTLAPLDIEIQKCSQFAYSHHIVRLMMFLNVMVLCRIHPDDVVQWFSETCAIDAYPWVMHSNVRCMGWYDTRFMTRPYISSSKYILRMSNYTKGEWCYTWDALFHAFVSDFRDKLVRGAGIYKSDVVDEHGRTIAHAFIQHVTNTIHV